jgi:hypothetical protein
MSSITDRERWLHPTVADVAGRLNVRHCGLCETWGAQLERFFTVGADDIIHQLDVIGPHMWAYVHRHDPMPLVLVGTHLRDDHGVDPEPGQNVFDVHDRLHGKN